MKIIKWFKVKKLQISSKKVKNSHCWYCVKMKEKEKIMGKEDVNGERCRRGTRRREKGTKF